MKNFLIFSHVACNFYRVVQLPPKNLANGPYDLDAPIHAKSHSLAALPAPASTQYSAKSSGSMNNFPTASPRATIDISHIHTHTTWQNIPVDKANIRALFSSRLFFGSRARVVPPDFLAVIFLESLRDLNSKIFSREIPKYKLVPTFGVVPTSKSRT